MYINITIPANKIHNEQRVETSYNGGEVFGAIYVGRGSYVSDLFVDTGIEFTIAKNRVIHNLHMGNYNSIGKNLQVILGRNHNIKKVDTGALELLLRENGVLPAIRRTHVQKGSVIFQNDIWAGENVTIMPGVIVRNGAVIARDSHVVKDIPAYAIVGGNPAKVIGYRFTEEQINMLQEIQWWYWDENLLIENAEYFTEDIDRFCETFYPDAHMHLQELLRNRQLEEESYFAFVDYYEGYGSYPLIIEAFINQYSNNPTKKLILFVQDDCEQPRIDENVYQYIQQEIELLNREKDIQCRIELRRGNDAEARASFINCGKYIVSRAYRTAYYSCLADLLNIKIISGVDNPIPLG